MAPMDWFDYLDAEGFLDEGFLHWKPARDAAERMRSAQADLNNLPVRLQNAGVSGNDPVTVSTLADFAAAFANVSMAVQHYEAMAILYNIKRIAEQLKDR
jgi:hypothetical protein